MSKILYTNKFCKVIQNLDNNIIEKFTLKKYALNEYLAIKNINSEYIRNVINIKDTDNDNIMKLELEYLDGYTLDELFYNSISFPKNNLLKQLLLGLNDIYLKNYIHRDIKPENIIWLPNEEKIKYIDFGYSKRIGFSYSTSKIKGTPLYLHPDMIYGKSLFFSDNLFFYDRYSLACSIKFLFTGKTFYHIDPNYNYTYPEYIDFIKKNKPIYFVDDILVDKIISDLINMYIPFDIDYMLTYF